MSKQCKQEVRVDHLGTVILWCNTCNETVGFNPSKPERLSVAEVAATAEGHQRVMDNARAIQRKYEKSNR